MDFTSKREQHELYLSGAMLVIIFDNPKGDYRISEILSRINSSMLKNINAKAIFYSINKLQEEGKDLDIFAVGMFANALGSSVQNVMEIYENQLSSASYEYHLDELVLIIEKTEILEGLSNLNKKSDNLSNDEIKEAMRGLTEVDYSTTNSLSNSEDIKQRLFHTEKIFIKTGCSALDRVLGGGFSRGNLVTLGMRSGAGKSSYALELCTGRANLGERTSFFSIEMDDTELINRGVSQKTGILLNDVKRAKSLGYEVLNQCEQATDFLCEHIDIYAKPSQTLSFITNELKRSHHKAKQEGLKIPEVAFVDYLDIIERPKGQEGISEYDLQGYLTRGLKKLAKELEITIVILVQLLKGTDKRENPKPKVSDIKGNGAIEANSNKIILGFRPNMYSDDKEMKNEPNQQAFIFVDKNREGSVGVVEYGFTPQTGIWRAV